VLVHRRLHKARGAISEFNVIPERFNRESKNNGITNRDAFGRPLYFRGFVQQFNLN
jgi:hypothetical protein